MKARKGLALILSVAMILSMLSLSAFAADEETAPAAPAMADAADSWASGSIDRWAQLGIVQGDSNGNFNPANPLSRGELATILVKMFGLTEKAPNTYADLKGDEWYADAILKCTAAGIMKGDGASCNATAQISRQETMVMFGRAVGVVPADKPDMSKFTDGADVADWAAGYMAPLAEMGIITGGGDGSVTPAANIDRASMMALLDKAVVEYVNAPGEVTVDNANGFVVVNVSAKEGEVVVSGKAAGMVVAAGTAEGKVVAKDLVADTVKVDGTAAVSIEGKSTVGDVTVNAAAPVEIAKGVKADTVAVNAPAEVTNNGTVKNLEANAAATVTNNGSITTLTANDAVKVDNKGTISKAEIKDDNVVLGGKKPSTIVVDDGVKNPTNEKGQEVKPGKPSTGGSSVPTSITVDTEKALNDALANTQYSTIYLGKDIVLSKQIVINRALTLDGGKFKVTVKAQTDGEKADRCGILVMANNVTIQNIVVDGPNSNEKGDNTWDDGQYGIQAYNVTGVTLNNVTVSNANAGILVNSASVTLTGTITLTENEFGGIEVSKGSLDTDKIPTLNASEATIVMSNESAAVPAIWIDGYKINNLTEAVAGTDKLIKRANPDTDKDQMFFFSAAVDEETLNTAIANMDIVKIGHNITLTEQIVINRALTLDGNGKTITAQEVVSDVKAEHSAILVMVDNVTLKNIVVDGPNSDESDWTDGEYGIQVYNVSGVTLDTITVSGANAGILVNSANVTLKGTITLTDNQWGGIEVAKGSLAGDGIPSLDVTNATIVMNNESATVPAIWIDGYKDGGLNKDVIIGADDLIEKENTEKNQLFLFTSVKDGGILETAINAGGTVKLDADITANVTIPAGKTVTLDLNEHKLTNTGTAAKGTIYNQGTLTVTGNGTVDNVTHAQTAIYNEMGATATLENGTFERSEEAGVDSENNGGNSYYTILNHGTMTIKADVTVNNKGHYSSLLENGWFKGSDNTSGDNSVLTIEGGTFDGGLNTIKNDDYGELVIEDGTFKNTTQATFLNWNIAIVNGGTFESEGNAILNGKLDDTMDKGELTITGGTFTYKDNVAPVVKMGQSQTIGDVTITGGSYKTDPTTLLDSGYSATESEGMWTVSEKVAE